MTTSINRRESMPAAKPISTKLDDEKDQCFGHATSFVCLFMMAGKFVCKAYEDLTDREWDQMMHRSGDWCHFIVGRDETGIATVGHASHSTVQDRSGFTLCAAEARALTDAEVVALSQEKLTMPIDLLAYLKDEFHGKPAHTNWSRRQLQTMFGQYAIDALIAQCVLVHSGEGWVALSHTQEGTIANALIEGLGIARSSAPNICPDFDCSGQSSLIIDPALKRSNTFRRR